MASVIHGFIYNVEAFDELGLSVPETEEEFFEVLAAIAADGSYIPLGMGTADVWEAATMGFQNIGPNYWNGEAGRRALIDGSAKLTDQAYVDTFASLEGWSEYLPPGGFGGDLHRCSEPLHPWSGCHLSGRILGNIRLQRQC